MKSEVDINRQLASEDLFALFSRQLVKDFEGAGLPGLLPVTIPRDFNQLCESIAGVLGRNSNSIPGLLYRVDISEAQIKKAGAVAGCDFESLLAELIVKRVLQKIIIRKNFSGK